ncbi:uncharacterized protein LOC130071063 [Rhinichthys klamathensis goyatoka]|uniref:uncharacterized protein LOC130071063 n=1 Tax=Rhinichthys klamathensis goyatoka TaxID=3034132 RepID=UPI0024B4D221|nr:uncharacterized protein LOC130071063 [Rhinichthys klamathensis goyatoka]
MKGKRCTRREASSCSPADSPPGRHQWLDNSGWTPVDGHQWMDSRRHFRIVIHFSNLTCHADVSALTRKEAETSLTEDDDGTALTRKEAETSLTGDDDGTALTRKEAETSITKGEVRKPLTGEKDGTAPLASIKTRRQQTVICPKCNMCMNKRNMSKHILRKHSGVHTLDVTSNSHLPSQCLDHLNGIFAVVKTMHGSSVPFHVKRKIWGNTQQVYCESPQCQSNHELAQRSKVVSFQCSHVRSVDYCSSTAESEHLKEDVLSEMVAKKWFGGDRKAECLKLQSLATSQSVPLSVETTVGVPTFKHYVSVFEPKVSYYSHLRRVMVVYNARTNSWHCPCIQSRRSCPHKFIAKWHLFQKYPELFRSKKSTETCIEVDQTTPENDDDLPDGGTHYPPNGTMLKNMVTYLYEQKKIPAILPRELCCQVHDNAFPKLLVPDEMFCTFCHDKTPLSDPILITSKARIVTMNGVVEGNISNLLMTLMVYSLQFLLLERDCMLSNLKYFLKCKIFFRRIYILQEVHHVWCHVPISRI